MKDLSRKAAWRDPNIHDCAKCGSRTYVDLCWPCFYEANPYVEKPDLVRCSGMHYNTYLVDGQPVADSPNNRYCQACYDHLFGDEEIEQTRQGLLHLLQELQ